MSAKEDKLIAEILDARKRRSSDVARLQAELAKAKKASKGKKKDAKKSD